uniref:Regulation of nuclear pre-mRNA domain-containing protein 1B n=1 Tax=Lepeophtheirus salmonis TaxID=72036 RepID=D3PJL8_LEPSM|nr:Regulation of nuclear pre-mRNA domain-containing protein 1B [Lepeophtheirus salmonis]
MSGFSEAALEKKLADLNNSQQSIQQLSLWLIHHRKHYQNIVKTWLKEMGKTNHGRKLTFLYLANDVVQNSKKKHPEYAKEFGSIMKGVVEHLANTHLDQKTIKSIGRLINIWRERSIFERSIQTDITRIWTGKTLESRVEADSTPPPQKKSKTWRKKSVEDEQQEEEEEEEEERDSNVLDSPPASVADPPEPEELIKALQDLENSASSDAVIREKIARLPPEVSEVSQLSNLQSAEEGYKLMHKVSQATELLSAYNERLQQELKDRKRVGKMITDFLSAQRDLEAQAEERLEQYRDKLEKVNAVKNDLKSHISSLPDLTKLPDVTGGLAPLPSAGDLFTIAK